MKLGIEQNVLKLRKQTGISHYLINIINNFKDIDITMFTQYNRHNIYDKVPRVDIKYNLKEINISKKQTINLLYFYSLGQKKYLKNIDVFWGQHFTQPLFLPKHTKLVSTIYDLIPFQMNNEAQNKMYNKLGKYLIKKTIYHSDIVVTISETVKKEITDMFRINSDRIKVVYPQLDHFKVYNNEEYKQKQDVLKEKYNLLPRQYFLTVYSIRPRKNIITVLKQYKNLDKGIKDKYPLVVVGYMDPRYKYVYDELYEEQIEISHTGGKVIFTNYIPDEMLEMLYNYQYLFISPSLAEGFDMPAVEQLLHNNIVIQSDIPIHKEVLSKFVYYFKPTDYIQLRNVIEGIMIYGKSKMIHDITPLYYFSHYTWKDQQNMYMNTFKEQLKM